MKKGYLYAFISIFFWASTTAVTKLLLKSLNSIEIMAISYVFAVITMLLITLFQKKLYIVKTLKLKDYLRFIFMGFVGIFLYTYLLYTALNYLPAQEALIINYLWPIMVVIFASLILKEKLNMKKIIAIVLSFIGIVIVVTKGNFSDINLNPIGLLMALSGSIIYGLFSVLSKKYNYDNTISMLFYFLTALICSITATLLFYKIPSISVTELLGIAWTGIFTSAIAFTAWTLALKYGDTAKLSTIIFLTPFLSLVYIYFILGESISIYSVIGLMVIVIGIFIQNKK